MGIKSPLCTGAVIWAMLISAAVQAQQVQAVRCDYLLLCAPTLAGQVGDSLVICRVSHQGLMIIGAAVLDELRGARAICRVSSVRSPYNVQRGDWVVESGGRTPVSQPSSANSATKPRVVAVRGDKVMIAGSCAPRRPGNIVAIEGLGKGGSRLIGTVRLSQVQAELAVASIASEGPGAAIRPGHWVAVTVSPAQQGEAAKVSAQSSPRVAKVVGGYVLQEGLPEQWPVGSVLEVVRQDGHEWPPVARLRLAQRKGDRGVATLRNARQGGEVQPGDLVVLPLPPAATFEDLDTYFFGSYRP